MTDHQLTASVTLSVLCLIALVAAFGAGIGPDYETTPRRVICRIVLAAFAGLVFGSPWLVKG